MSVIKGQRTIGEMKSINYFLLKDSDRIVVIHGETGLRLKVFYLANESFIPISGELHLYGDDYGEPLAFETEGYQPENLNVFEGAVLWFARFLDYPQMQILQDDPRSEFRLYKV